MVPVARGWDAQVGVVATMTDVQFRSHRSRGDGGVLCLWDGSRAVLTRGSVTNNMCINHGAVAVLAVTGTEPFPQVATLEARDSVFAGNSAGVAGGVVQANGGSGYTYPWHRREVSMSNCALRGNSAGFLFDTADIIGGAWLTCWCRLWCLARHHTRFMSCLCHAETTSSGYGGAVAIEGHALVALRNCTLDNNTAAFGGSLSAYGPVASTVVVFGGNISRSRGSDGGAAYLAQQGNLTLQDGVSIDSNQAVRYALHTLPRCRARGTTTHTPPPWPCSPTAGRFASPGGRPCTVPGRQAR